MTKSKEQVAACLREKRDFFVLGEIGWGKTTVTTDLAKKAGFSVVETWPTYIQQTIELTRQL